MSDNNDKKSKELFACWENTSKNGNVYLRGKLADGTEIIGFKNSTKKNEKEPDYRFYRKDDAPSKKPANESDPF